MERVPCIPSVSPDGGKLAYVRERGKIVGVPSQGAVISTPRRKLLDLGEILIPERGWYVAGTGENMELNAVQPDFVLWPEPGEMPAGRDRQLEKAVDVLLDDLR